MSRTRLRLMAAAVGVAATFIAACGGPSGLSVGNITIATKNFSENSLMGVMTKLLLQKHGYTVTLKEIAGNASIRDGLTSKQYDGYWEYLGTGLVDVNNIETPIGDPVQAVAKLNSLDQSKGIVWLAPAVKFDDPDVLVIKKDKASQYGTTFSQLAAYVKANPTTKFCVQSEFTTRTAGLKAIAAKYGLPNPQQLSITIEKESIAVQDAANAPDRCEVSQAFGTDAQIDALGLLILKDDQQALPSDSLSLTMLKSTLDAHPDIRDDIKPLTDIFSTADSKALQKQVDVEKQDPVTVCTNYLKNHGLL